jgi:DNA modification methylase
LKQLTYRDYLEYRSRHDSVVIEDQEIRLDEPIIKKLYPEQRDFIDPRRGTDLTTTVWSFPKRGSWATHRGDYRGNWPPQIPHILIRRYTKPGETVLDPMIGGGTTCIEAKLLGRNCIGIDINYESLILTLHRLYYLDKYIRENKDRVREELLNSGINDIDLSDILNADIKIFHGDSRKLDVISDSSIDLVATHPPYYNIIRYGRNRRVIGDLSSYKRLEEYLLNLRMILEEIYRVLKPGRYLGILVGDTRIRKHYVPLTHHVLEILLSIGFVIREEIVKIQHKMKTTREFWRRIKNRDYLLIYHEKLYILRKPLGEEDRKKYRYSGYLNIMDLA